MAILYRKGKALFVVKDPIDKTLDAIEYCKTYELMLEIIVEALPHDEFMQKLLCVEWYLDLKGLTSPDVLSVSGIEALMQGCKVLVDTGEVVTEFTTSNFLQYVDLYKKLLF